jgi:hypothetical protein
MKWDWGNSDSDKIYHDPKPDERVTYRTNLARLMDQLIVKKSLIAKTIIDLAMTKCH